MTDKDNRRVAVIGAGGAGLCAAKLLKDSGVSFNVFEQTSTIGGTWVYTDSVGQDQYGLPIHSSMYKNLRTNIPSAIMSYPDFPFPEDCPSFPGHATVLKHLKNYADCFDLYHNILFNSHVKSVSPLNSQWNVQVTELKTGNLKEYVFDGVIVCNGHYSVPHFPDIADLDQFSGLVLHSHGYREPECFSGLDVLVLGAGPSGTDISLEIAKVARKVYLSHNKPPLTTSLPENIVQVVGIKNSGKDGFNLLDGSYVEAQAIVFCTGYKFEFPFLSDDCGIKVVNNRVTPLYKHVLYRDNPTLAIVGIPYTVVPFVIFYYQIKYFLSVWLKKIELPNIEQMAAEEECDYKRHISVFSEKHAHKFDHLQWDYFKDLAISGHFPHNLPSVVQEIYEDSRHVRTNNLLEYREVEYEVLDKNSYIRRPSL